MSLVLAFRVSTGRNEEIGHLRREAERREEELRLLRQQVDAEQEERLRQQQARVSVFEGVRGNGSGHGIEYTVPIQNTARCGAHALIAEPLSEGAGPCESLGRQPA